MRLSRTAWLILGIGIFAIAIGVLGWAYLQQVHEQKELNNSLSLAQATLPTVISQRADLESQLSQAKSKLQAARSSFPDFVDSIRVDDKLFEIADGCGDLKITSITSSEPTEEETEGVTYSVASFVLEVEGEVDNMLDFINTIATDEYFTNATVELVEVEVPEPQTKGESTSGEWEKPSATINLVIYGYQGE